MKLSNPFKKKEIPLSPKKEELQPKFEYEGALGAMHVCVPPEFDERLLRVELKLNELMRHLLEETYKGSGRKKLTKAGQSLRKSLLK